MSIKTRLALLLGLLLVGFLVTWLVLERMEQMETDHALADARANRVRMLNHWINLNGRSLPQFTAEYAQKKGLAAGAQIPPETRQQITRELTDAAVDTLWILEKNGVPLLRIDTSTANPAAPPIPIAPPEFSALVAETPSPRFFAEQDKILLEVCVRRIAEPEGPGHWLMVARRWDDFFLRSLAGLSESDVRLVFPGENAEPASAQANAVVLRPLPDWQGRTVRLLRAEYADDGLARMLRNDTQPARILIFFGAALIVAVSLALQGWVLRPLAKIERSLAERDAAPLASLAQEKTELGQVAQLVEFSFAQTEALRKSEASLRQALEERARLGRDLHDGVIQSLYAAGMGVAGIRVMLEPGQPEVANRLDQTREILNETINDVRNFITGMEPEALKQQSFAHAVATLTTMMQAIRPLRANLEIDDAVAAQLSLAQRVHALQIAREAVSNALRHGEADQVTLTLRAKDGTAEFEIRDNGRGFDQTAHASKGLGLGNLVERARELGAELTVQSAPGKGTHVRLVFPMSFS